MVDVLFRLERNEIRDVENESHIKTLKTKHANEGYCKRIEKVDGAAVAIPLEAVEAVSSRFVDLSCSLCDLQEDSHEHLFFECNFSKQVWFKVKRFTGLSNSMPSIDSIIHDIIHFAKRKSSRSIIAKLVVAATTYFIWQERNNRMFKKSKRSVEQVADCIINVVRLKLLSCKWKKSKDGSLPCGMSLGNLVVVQALLEVNMQAQQKQQSLYNGRVLLEKHDPPAVYDSEETLQLAQESRLKQLNKINKLYEVFISQKAKSQEEGVQNFENHFVKEAAKFVRDFKSLVKEADSSIDKISVLEKENERLLRAVVSQDIMSIVQSTSVVDTSHLQTELDYTKEKLEASYNDMQNQIEQFQAQLGDLKGKSMDTQCALDTLEPLSQKLEDESVNHPVVRQPNAFLSERPKSSKTRVPPKVVETNDLSNPVTSNLVPTTNELKVVKNDKVIALGMFKINPSTTFREDKFVPINQARASIGTKPITVSQPHVITKKDVNSNSNSFSSTRVDITAKTRRPQPRRNTKNDRVPSASKSSCIKNKEVEVEEHPKNLLLSKNKKHMSSEFTSNHDICVLNYVNDMNSHVNNFNVNVSNTANKKKHKPKVKKPKKLGSKESLASPKPSEPGTCLKWSPTGRMFDLKRKIVVSSDSECRSESSKGDNACTSNPKEPLSQRFPNSTFSLAGHSNMFMVRRLGMLKAYDKKSKATYKFCLEVSGKCSLWK
ncbi:hypothetical protein Tco_0462647 [Tanacetum coccineum]